jgi:integrase
MRAESGVELPAPRRSLDYFSAQELSSLLAHAAEHAPTVYPMIAFCAYSGARKGECFGARWSDIDFEAQRIDINRSYDDLPKSGKARHLPLHPELAPILRAWKERCPKTPEGLLFPVEAAPGRYRMGVFQDSLDLPKLLVAADCHVPDKPWHALRHSFASHAVMRGVSLYAVQQLLGHASSAMTQIYAHLAPDHLASEVARLSFPKPAQGDVLDFEAERRKRDDALGTHLVQEANAKGER